MAMETEVAPPKKSCTGYMTVVTHQQFSGAWKLDQPLADALGKELGELKAAATIMVS
jgi:hypothetical protein